MTDPNDSPAPAPSSSAPRPLARGARGAALLGGAIEFVLGSLIAGAADIFWLSGKSEWPLPRGVAAACVIALLAFRGFVYPFFWFRSWRWRLDERSLITSYGWLWRTEHAVPLDRIQHVDVDSSPIDRVFAVSSVTVFTAGSGHASLLIPGLLVEDAERLRDALLGRERDVQPDAS